MRGSDFGGDHVEHVDLRGADLRDTNFEESDLSGADLRGARLEGAKLAGARLSGAVYEASTQFSADFEPDGRGLVRRDPASASRAAP